MHVSGQAILQPRPANPKKGYLRTVASTLGFRTTSIFRLFSFDLFFRLNAVAFAACASVTAAAGRHRWVVIVV